jgi:HTH-type transcriptional regulator, global nitrogen regulator NrpRI
MENIRTQRRMVAILRVLRNAPKAIGSEQIADELRLSGMELSERTIRNYLVHADSLGWTQNLGRRGRKLTPLGIREADHALVIDKVGFVAARVDELAYQMSFNLATRKGKVILNISTVSEHDIDAAIECMSTAYKAKLGMGRLVAVRRAGATLGDFTVPAGMYAIGTVCSVSMNGILLRASIAAKSRFGGLLELDNGEPKRFTQIINYDGSSLDPLEIFIRGHMTSVTQAARTGSGVLGASFREVPRVATPEVRRLAALSEKAGLGGVLAIGGPDQPLLDIPVAQGRVGLIIIGGLNPVAAVVEAGISVNSTAMSTLCEFHELVSYTEAARLL